MTRRLLNAIVLVTTIVVASCDARPSPAGESRINSARWLTQRYSQSRLARWNVRAGAAGKDCTVLLIKTSMILDDSLVEAMHYGSGPYDIYPGGVNRFYRDRTFLGVAYEDRSRRIWTYGEITSANAEKVARCS
jgi:hypothetical protein